MKMGQVTLIIVKLLDSLEINEVYDMFQQNGININEETLKRLFSIVDKRNTGALDLENFKKFAMSEEANNCTFTLISFIEFRKIIQRLRKK